MKTHSLPSGFPAAQLMVVMGPVIVAAALTAALAFTAAALGWRRDEALIIAAGAGFVAALPSMVLLFYQRAERRAALHVLHSVEERVGSIVESAMDAIITVDESQHIVLFNTAAEAVFGYTREEALGAPLDSFIPARFRYGHAAHVQRFGATSATARRMGAERIVRGLRRSGEEFPIDASISQSGPPGARFYTVILRDVTERVRNEEALALSRAEIHSLALSASLAREQEKSRFARELHDELGQSLTALKIDVGWLRENMGYVGLAVHAKFEAMQASLDSTVAATRRIASDLRPLMLDDLGLEAACDWLAQNFTQRTGVPCRLHKKGDLDLADPHATAVFRVLQESLTNAARHASATTVEVTVERDAEAIMVKVRDNGRGFRRPQMIKAGSYGFTGMRERATLLGGTVIVESDPGEGTLVVMRLPAPETEDTP